MALLRLEEPGRETGLFSPSLAPLVVLFLVTIAFVKLLPRFQAMGPAGVSLASYRVMIGLFFGGRTGLHRHASAVSFVRCGARPLLLVLPLFLWLRAASLPNHGDVERNPGPDTEGSSRLPSAKASMLPMLGPWNVHYAQVCRHAP